MMERLSHFILRHRGLIAVVFVSLFLYCGLAATRIDRDFTPDALIQAGDPEEEVWAEIQDVFGDTKMVVCVILEGPSVYRADFLRALQKIGDKLDAMRGIVRVVHLANIELIRGERGGFTTDPVVRGDLGDPATLETIRREAAGSRLIVGTIVSKDGTATALTAELSEKLATEEERTPVVDQVESVVRSGLPPGFNYRLAGFPVVNRDYTKIMRSDQKFNIPVAISLIFFMLLVLFRSIRGIAVPLIVMGVSLTMVLGAIVILGRKFTIVNSAIPTIILIIGVADSIHMLARYYEETGKGAGKAEAVRAMVAHVGWACLLTSLTTAIGFASLGMADMTMIREYGLLVAVGILIVYVTTLLVSPILLSFWRKPRPDAVARVGGKGIRGFIDLFDRLVQRRRKIILVAFILITLPALWGVLHLNIDNRLLEDIDENHPLQQAYRLAESKFSGLLHTTVSVEGEGENSVIEPEVLEAIDGLAAFIAKQDGILKTVSIVDYLKEMNQATFEGRPEQYRVPQSRELAAQYLLLYSFGDDTESLRRMINHEHENSWTLLQAYNIDDGDKAFFKRKEAIDSYIAEHFPPTVKARLAGGELVWNKGLRGIMRDLIASFMTAFVLIFFVIAASFRSLRLAALAMVPNLFPIVVTLGIMGLTGITMRLGSVIVFSVGLGIAVDDTIHILARLRSEMKQTDDLELAFSRTIHSTGRAVVFTTVVLVFGFLIFLRSDFLPVRQMGVLNAITLTAALVGDLIILPALFLTFRKAITPRKGPQAGPEVGPEQGARPEPLVLESRTGER